MAKENVVGGGFGQVDVRAVVDGADKGGGGGEVRNAQGQA